METGDIHLISTEPYQFLDTSTQFMFGEPIGCLLHPQRAKLAWAMTDVLRGLRFRLMMVRLLWLFRHKAWYDAIDVVHDYINRHIDKAYGDLARKQVAAEVASSGKESTAVVEETPERKDLLWFMVPHFGEDRERLRSEMLVLFAPNNDTTAILIRNVFCNLGRRADIYAKVRKEVMSHGPDAPLTYERLRSTKYLDAVLNETHRLYPKGDAVRADKVIMFRDKDLLGEDTDEFKPERWYKLSPSWSFMPFGGGPRRCPAQTMATVEASYCIARFARRFKAIENRDVNSFYVPIIRVSPVHKNGV
ncbi:cytochrome P450 [Colletotrichum navitas]|uniref:Cytochrome P450 n=1 Tax=Colletotrichum navitas TaxID=681940 RepID=A0AAD8PL58_9PEZI|nr:cytochrome P450 [Colletotrichum navitas]KAK1569422.1 cytochrome P450 [Colletotrichum navitas]